MNSSSITAILVKAASLTALVPHFAFAADKSRNSDVATLRLNDRQIVPVAVSRRGTILSFPTKPTKVILGNAGSFGIEYVENDLAVSPLKTDARSNLFVYLYGRRFSFDLRTGAKVGSSLVIVKDSIAEGENGRR